MGGRRNRKEVQAFQGDSMGLQYSKRILKVKPLKLSNRYQWLPAVSDITVIDR